MAARAIPAPFCMHLSKIVGFCQFLLLPCAACFAQGLDSLAIGGTALDVDILGNLFVVDSDRNSLALYSREGKLLRQVSGQGWGNDQFDRPLGIWSRNGLDVFVADYGNHRVQRFDRTLSYVSTLFTREANDPAVRFGYPTDVTLSRLGALFLCDSENDRIVKVSMSNQIERGFGGLDAGAGRLLSPTQVEVGPNDQVYVLDGNRVIVFDVFGNFLNQLAAGLFTQPSLMVADENGTLVLDRDLLYSFDARDRPSHATEVRALTQGRLDGRSVRSLAFARGILYLLTEKTLFLIRDFLRNQSEGVEKEQETQ
jgi:hypothetical protein